MIGTIVLGLVFPGLLFVAVIGFLVNFIIRIVTAQRIGIEIVWFRQVGPLLSCAQVLLALAEDASAAITGSMNADLAALRSLGVIARWVSGDPLTVGDLCRDYPRILQHPVAAGCQRGVLRESSAPIALAGVAPRDRKRR